MLEQSSIAVLCAAPTQTMSRDTSNLHSDDEFGTLILDGFGKILSCGGPAECMSFTFALPPLYPLCHPINVQSGDEEMKSERVSADPSTSTAKNTANAAVKGNGAARKVRDTSTVRATAGGSDCSREQLIAERAYFHAEKRGFEPNNDLADWLQAEAEIDGM